MEIYELMPVYDAKGLMGYAMYEFGTNKQVNDL